METNLFKRVYIKSADDLPRNGDEWYYGHVADTDEIVRLRDTQHSEWSYINWYFKPVDPAKERERIIEVLNNHSFCNLKISSMSLINDIEFDSIADKLMKGGE